MCTTLGHFTTVLPLGHFTDPHPLYCRWFAERRVSLNKNPHHHHLTLGRDTKSHPSSLNMSKMAQLIQSKKTAKQQKVFYFAAEVIKPRQPKTTTSNVTTKVSKKLEPKNCGEIGPRGNRSVDITFTARTGGGNGLQVNRKEGISLWMDQIDLKREVPIRSNLYGCHAVSVKTKSSLQAESKQPGTKGQVQAESKQPGIRAESK